MTSPLPDDDHLPEALVAAWRSDTVSEAELRRGYARFLKHRQQRHHRRRVALIAVGLLLAASVAAAATLLHTGGWSRREATQEPHAGVSPPSNPMRPAGATSLDAPGVAPPSAGDAAMTDSPTSEAPRMFSAPSADITSMTAAPSAHATRSSPGTAGLLRQRLAQLQWQRVADAMRDSEFASAESGLLAIERATVGAERDAARLARAQLLLRRGDSAQAFEIAQSLSAGSTSAPTRDKARALVERLTKDSGAHRSDPDNAAAEQP